MNIYSTAFISGLIAVLTPIIFSQFIIVSVLFEKLGRTNKQYKTNALLYCFLIICIYLLIIAPSLSVENLNNLSNNLKYFVLLDSSFILFLIFLLGSFIKKLESFYTSFWKSFIRFFGLIIFSFRLAFGSLSAIGPIIGTLLVSNSLGEDSHNKYEVLLTFSIGLVIPFLIILGLISYKYPVLKLKIWWRIIQLIIISILLIDSISKLFLLL